ncbi:dihydrofolate reductase [PVC group bacterium]|nr:dihydrofolate reductase [PVC group bacterium]
MPSFNIMVASTQQGRIGKNGQLPWSISQDMIRFKKITTHHDDSKKMNAVIMGRKT